MEKSEDNIWNYRVVEEDSKFILAKVYYSNGKLSGYERVSGQFSTLEELKGDHKLMMTAFDETILKFKTQ